MIRTLRLPCMARYRWQDDRHKEGNRRKNHLILSLKTCDSLAIDNYSTELDSISREYEVHTIIIHIERPDNIGIESTDDATRIQCDYRPIGSICDIHSFEWISNS
jgi:hypothetical protein